MSAEYDVGNLEQVCQYWALLRLFQRSIGTHARCSDLRSPGQIVSVVGEYKIGRQLTMMQAYHR